jgi:hypothetical protein
MVSAWMAWSSRGGMGGRESPNIGDTLLPTVCIFLGDLTFPRLLYSVHTYSEAKYEPDRRYLAVCCRRWCVLGRLVSGWHKWTQLETKDSRFEKRAGSLWLQRRTPPAGFGASCTSHPPGSSTHIPSRLLPCSAILTPPAGPHLLRRPFITLWVPCRDAFILPFPPHGPSRHDAQLQDLGRSGYLVVCL